MIKTEAYKKKLKLNNWEKKLVKSMDTWQIILAIFIVGLSIVMPIYYSSEKKKNEQKQELEKIKKYAQIFNQFTRDKKN